MRIALVVHGFPPYERTGVENYTAGLARALARRGHTVEVFAPRSAPELPEHSLRREERDGFAVTWVTLNQGADGPRAMLDRPEVTRSFAQFLDSERPAVVHFQHVVKLGLGPLFEASQRGIPIVYTAHDYYAVCHRYTLLRPDLTHCDVRGDFMACALCDASLGYLNGLEGLGDYQMGVLPEQLDESQRAGLKGLLEDDPEPAGWDQGALDAATDLRRELDSLRLQAFTRVDRVLAPTRFLADELARGGIPRERIEVLPYGVETKDLLGLPAVRPADDAALRFAFCGGLSKHKGVHVLLDAFGLLGAEARAQLTIWGYGSDEPYVARLRARADEVGAHWGGAYDRAELPAILAAADVVVVPSTWVENQPLVIREAFAAGRPVIASDFGAIPESVRHDVDGLLFRVGDAGALASEMRRCFVENGLVARLAQGIQPVHDAADQALELEQQYERLVAEARSAASEEDSTPTSVKGLQQRLRELEDLPTRTLFERVMAGLGELRKGLGAGDGTFEERLAQVFAGEPRARVTLRDSLREAEWLRVDFERESKWLHGVVEKKEEEIAWLRGEIAVRDEHLGWLRERHDVLAEDLAQLEELGSRLSQEEFDREGLDALEARFDRVRNHIAEVGGQAAPVGIVAHHLLEAQALLVSAELRPLFHGLHDLAGQPLPQDGDDPADALLALVRGTSAIGEGLLREVSWRRAAMASAQDKAGRKLAGMLLSRTGLGREVLAWPSTLEEKA